MMSNKHHGGHQQYGGNQHYGGHRSNNPLDLNHDGKVDYKGRPKE